MINIALSQTSKIINWRGIKIPSFRGIAALVYYSEPEWLLFVCAGASTAEYGDMSGNEKPPLYFKKRGGA
jgi:hypothetical protein